MDTRGLRFVDLSVTLENSEYTDPPSLLPHIEYSDHAAGAEEMATMFPGLTPDHLPGREGWAGERMKLTAHNGTHMDAPWHYASTTDGGKPAYGIEALPLDWCFRPGVKLDFRDRPNGHVVTAAEVEAELKRIGYSLQPLDIVLVNTSAAALYGKPGYLDAGCGMGREATLYLLERGVRVVGTDAWSWDAPFKYTRERFAKTGDASLIWEGHKAGRDIGYGQMEKLTHLELLPPFGYTVACFPYKIRHGSAGFTRAVAIFSGRG
ncbi:kynurenine formamidase [Archangium gephyra]|uniref:Kynurenine formamidase n=1 Tax=Archangium gephyra TaxID=48 RepID=A0AAC8TBZ4_9BACT|nr:cyclase family protein [Archangium gephyra]AKJ00422.1 Metal-dependent hydrolase [Archangium gephyra]REG32879.1 kynurenine formamidase [Archangium gephyra]